MWKKSISYHSLPLPWISTNIIFFIRAKFHRDSFSPSKHMSIAFAFFQFGSQFKDSLVSNEQKSFDSWNSINLQSRHLQLLLFVKQSYKNWGWALRKQMEDNESNIYLSSHLPKHRTVIGRNLPQPKTKIKQDKKGMKTLSEKSLFF